MKEVTINDAVLRKAAGEGMDAFVAAFVAAIKEAIGGELTSETLAELNSAARGGHGRWFHPADTQRLRPLHF